MAFVIALLTLVMVLDCVVLIFLVLIQLPKKEAGAGLAFGGSATDALFGAGSGTVLTKITKYAGIVFFALAVILSILQESYHRRDTTIFATKVGQPGRQPSAPLTPPPVTPPVITAPSTNAPLLSTPPELTNLPPAATNLISAPSNNPPPSK